MKHLRSILWMVRVARSLALLAFLLSGFVLDFKWSAWINLAALLLFVWTVVDFLVYRPAPNLPKRASSGVISLGALPEDDTIYARLQYAPTAATGVDREQPPPHVLEIKETRTKASDLQNRPTP